MKSEYHNPVQAFRSTQLSLVRQGSRVKILAIHAGRELQARLAAMGLVPGTEITVISNQSSGPSVVAVKDSRVVLGRGMSSKIEVL